MGRSAGVLLGVLAALSLPGPALAVDPQIAALQVALTANRFYAGAIDGIAGTATSSAVRSLQREAGLTPDGAGAGTVTGSPTGITCPATCSAPYPSGTVVTLTATPVAGSAFTGWSGAGCTGTGPCTVTVSAALPTCRAISSFMTCVAAMARFVCV